MVSWCFLYVHNWCWVYQRRIFDPGQSRMNIYEHLKGAGILQGQPFWLPSFFARGLPILPFIVDLWPIFTKKCLSSKQRMKFPWSSRWIIIRRGPRGPAVPSKQGFWIPIQGGTTLKQKNPNLKCYSLNNYHLVIEHREGKWPICKWFVMLYLFKVVIFSCFHSYVHLPEGNHSLAEFAKKHLRPLRCCQNELSGNWSASQYIPVDWVYPNTYQI